MKTKYLLGIIILSLATVNFVVSASKIYAQDAKTPSDVQYPVRELGGCKDRADCSSYCDKSENIQSCIGFAEKNNLMSEEEIKTAKKFTTSGNRGPGGCTGRDSCEKYCDDISRIDECVAFAEKNNMMPEKELAEAKKIRDAIKRGAKPPACSNKKQCDVYCEDPGHMEECITFGVEAGFIQGKELEDSQKMMAAIKRGVKPPPCKGKKACDEYCNKPDNMEACMNFAMEAGFMSDKEKENSQKILQAIKKGIKPPACKSKEECDAYCAEENHFEECAKFAEAAGFMTPEEAKMARKTGGKGPGNCKSKDECEAFCGNSNNQEICLNFAKDNGMMPEEDLKKMDEGKQKFKESLGQMPPAVLSCLDSELGTDMMAKFKSGAAMPPREIGEKMRECFEKNRPQKPEGENMPPGDMKPGNMTPDNISPRTRGMPGSGPRPCEGEDCPPPPSGPNNGPSFGPGSSERCEGSNCPQIQPGERLPGMSPGQQPGQQLPPGGPTTPRSGGETPPGPGAVPPAPPSETPIYPSKPSSYNFRNLLGMILNSFGGYLAGR